MFPELLWNSVRGCFGSIDPCCGGLLLPTDSRLILRRLCTEGPRVFVQILRRLGLSLSLSAQSRSVDTDRGNVGTPTTSSMRAHSLQEETFLMSSILSTFVMYIIYVSSSLDSLTLRSGVLGEERQVTVFAVRASRYPTQRRRGGNTTFFFRLC